MVPSLSTSHAAGAGDQHLEETAIPYASLQGSDATSSHSRRLGPWCCVTLSSLLLVTVMQVAGTQLPTPPLRTISLLAGGLLPDAISPREAKQLEDVVVSALNQIPLAYARKYPGMVLSWTRPLRNLQHRAAIVVGIFGPSGAGKSTTAREFLDVIRRKYAGVTAAYIDGDSMYKVEYDLTDKSTPSAIDYSRITKALSSLIEGRPAQNVTYFNPWLPNARPEQRDIAAGDIIVVDSFMGDLDSTLNSFYDVALLVTSSPEQRWLRRVGYREDGHMLAEAAYMKKYEVETNRMILDTAPKMQNAVLVRNGNSEYVLAGEKHLAAMTLATALSLSLGGRTSLAEEEKFVRSQIRPLFDSAWSGVFRSEGMTGSIDWKRFKALVLRESAILERVKETAFLHHLDHVVHICKSPYDWRSHPPT